MGRTRKEVATVTPADIIYRRRVRVIERAAEVGVTQACREAGLSRTSSYRWVGRASRYGLSALMPKDRRPPRMPNQIPAHEEEIILTEAVSRPTLGAGRLLEHLAERGVRRSASGVAKVLRRHGLATRRARVAALAALTAADTGLLTPGRSSRAGSAWPRPGPASSSAWTASTSASSRGLGRSTS
jgi:transposase